MRIVTTNFSLDIMDLSYVSITFNHNCSVCTSNKKAFQLKVNRPPSGRYMGYIVNEFKQARDSSHVGRGSGIGVRVIQSKQGLGVGSRRLPLGFHQVGREERAEQ